MSESNYPQRKSPRLAGYTYTRSGAYFVTICTYHRKQFFGAVTDEAMYLSPLGKIAFGQLQTLSSHFPSLSLDAFVVMPNHIHAILMLHDHPELRPRLGQIVGSYKAGVTRNARRELTNVPSRIWQSRYHDHVIRNDKSLAHICEYVQNNPLRWHLDTYFS